MVLEGFMGRYSILVITCLLLAQSALADVIHVPGDYPNIYQAIDSAIDGDVIEVAAGTYFGSYLSPQGKSITISGETNADGSSAVFLDGQQSGAVLYCNDGEDASTIFRNLVLTNGSSYYGGGMSNINGSSPRIEDCVFLANIGTIEGGGVHNRDQSNPEFINCHFESNQAFGPGGGMYNMDSSPTLSGCTFISNMADDGGGLYCDYDSNPTLSSCTFESNIAAAGGGGAIMIEGGEEGEGEILNCTFNNNTAVGSGGAIYNTYYIIESCYFRGNHAGTSAGAVMQNSGEDTVDCYFESNSSDLWGGGAVSASSGSKLISCTFLYNYAHNGSGGGADLLNQCDVIECIFIGNQADEVGGGFHADSSPYVSGCYFADNSASLGGGMEIQTGVGNVENTVFCGNTPDHISGNWQDLGGNEFYEECPIECLADINSDGNVGFNDLLLLLAAWGTCPDCQEDLDESGDVGFNDLLLMLAAWGPCP